ncbi:hypothetical protein ACYULU_03415 [Breznakiellaceae bacterium SP9]
MATTFNREYQKTLEGRGLALSSKRFAIQMFNDAQDRKDDLETILFGNDTNYGIVSILSLYYNQIFIGQGRQTTKPLLHDPSIAKSQYQNDFTLSVTLAGDGAGGLHPPQTDNPSAGQDDVDINSIWLTTHDLESNASGIGILQKVQTLLDTIGVTASASTDGRGSYSTQAAAQAQAALDRGSGLLGLRSENSEIYSSGTDTLQWWIGQNGIDAPDTFTTKYAIISALTDLKSAIENLLSVFQTTLDMLQGAGRAILDDFKIELPDDDADLNSMITQFISFDAKVQGYISYIDQFSDPAPSENRAEINTYLESIKTNIQFLSDAINTRCDSIPAMMSDVTSGINKFLTHWVTEIVKKPDGPYSMILAAQNMLAMAEANIQKKNDVLIFFEQNHDLWIELTYIQVIYDRVVIDLDQSIKRIETDIIWNPIQSANKYKVLSMPFSEISTPLSNEAWDESSGAWVVNKLESGFLNNMITITPPTESTLFRIVAFDTEDGDSGDLPRIDSFNTKSKQTDIISDSLTFTQKDNRYSPDGRECSIISFDEATAKLIKERDFLWLNKNEIAQIIAISDSDYLLDTVYGIINSVKKLFGLYFVTPTESAIEE